MNELQLNNAKSMNVITDECLLEMESYCKARFKKKYFIPNNCRITLKQMERLRTIKEETNQFIFSDCFERVNSSEKGNTYYVEVSCNKCGKVFEKKLSKTALVTEINWKLNNVCNDCQILIDKEDKQKSLENEKIKQENTDFFIDNYLNPVKSFVNIKEGYYYLTHLFCDDERISDYIQEMPYKDFLNTPYWKAIAYKKKEKTLFKCELCNSNENICVHHKTYINHGKELYNMKDLIVLCKNCHEKFHDIVKE